MITSQSSNYIAAIEWLKTSKYTITNSEIYKNPIGDGWCCHLCVTNGEFIINREAVGETVTLACQLVALKLARELGWSG